MSVTTVVIAGLVMAVLPWLLFLKGMRDRHRTQTLLHVARAAHAIEQPDLRDAMIARVLSSAIRVAEGEANADAPQLSVEEAGDDTKLLKFPRHRLEVKRGDDADR
jgi:hypothetical protein